MSKNILKDLYARILFILAIFFILNTYVFSQEKQNLLTREVIVTRGDSVIRSSILVNNPEIKQQKLMYYWYYDSDIRNNIGGFGGDLLHGSYIVFDKNNNMAVKGNFASGLKNGIWMYWYPNGNMKTEIYWNNGVRDGISKYYNLNGKLMRFEKYKKDILQEQTIYNDAGEITETITYHNGKKIETKKDKKENQKIQKKPFLKNIFSRKEKEEQDNLKEENTIDKPKEKKSFIKFPKRKEDAESME